MIKKLTLVLLMGILVIPVEAQTPQLTEIEQLRVENLQLKLQLSAALQRVAELERLQNQLALAQETAQLLERIEKAYPGFTLRDGRLVKKETP